MQDDQIPNSPQAESGAEPAGSSVHETAKVSPFLEIKVKAPLTREVIVKAVEEALTSESVIPTFHSGTPGSSSTLDKVEATADGSQKQPASEYPKDSLLMLIQQEGGG